ncbi:APC family permease [Nocardioides nitrophenolicus]|uniref:APC family permease n=1 Tax=Nocardioides nitrophenolicus TaxID=60489 RepID=UPI001958B381|nr:APC family permease [Nocardioides nitrophenolicus]MBM7515061.1 amino acid transporter [Nocardioides nitrophenolicus]
MTAERRDSLKADSITPWGIVFMVVATAAPLTAMATALPLVVGFGNGVAAPGTFLLVAVVLALFAVGYTSMSAHVVNAGAFYAYISAGLGRRIGMAAGLVAVVAYNVLTIYVVGLIGYFSQQTFEAQLGLDLPWWVFSALALAIAVVIGIRGVELNVRALGVILLVETGVLVLFDIVSIARHGLDVLPAQSFSPSEVMSGSPGLALLFAVTCFIGFEATAIFGEEARDPHRTVPKATYLAISVIGTLYVLTAWVLVGTNGGTDAGSVAAADPGVFTIDAMASVLGDGSTTVIDWLLLTSLLAVLMALHNMSSRYLMAFGREGVLPRYLAHTHPERQTPQAAGITQAALVAVVALVYVLAGADPYVDLGSQAAGIGSLSVIMLMALCSFSVPFYFRRRGAVRPWHHVIAPVAAGLALAYFSYVILDNYALVTGSDSDLVNAMPLLILATAVVGYVIGSRQRRAPLLDAVAQGDPAESATPTP